MGENIQREWDEEPFARELWDALQLRKQDRDAGIAKLTDLADRGSGLAMMYIGHDRIFSANQEEAEQGERWLAKSARRGSIEGQLQLALHYERQRVWDKALAELTALAQKGYSPATYHLARLLYGGDLGYRAVPEAVAYLKVAIDAGHLPSIGLLSQIYRREKFGISGRIAAHWLCLTKMPGLLHCVWSYPKSDRLRPWSARFAG